MNNDKTYTERHFQESLVEKLEDYRWTAPLHLNGMKKKVTVNDLIDNWRSELNRLNADILEGIPLTDDEFRQVMNEVNKLDNSFEAAKLLSMEQSVGKIAGIFRDPNPSITREKITLTIFGKAQVSGGNSNYQIATEVCTDNGNRFDVVLLINGLPLINIELKRADVSTDEAFNQFKRYYRDGEYVNNFMAFSQMMIIMSETDTRYFATPKSINDFNKSFVFHWADRNNRSMHAWENVVEHFLKIPMAHQMVGDYLVIDEALREENQRHMVMRPYQVYALQAVEKAAFGRDNDDIPHGGYIWHTTGSGKTITSFKTALFLSTRVGFDKVVFMVDRRELDSKTSENFKAYAAYEPVTVDDTKYTSQLRNLMKSKSRGIIVTTTFKMNGLVKELVENQDDSLKDKKVVFIIDEAHRTTMGSMMGTIKDYFRKKGLFFGFTGTPLFDENEVTGMINEKSELIDTTEKLFGPSLHEYTIDQAISDMNVLGFDVEYLNTGEFLNHQQLRDDLVEALVDEKPDKAIREIEKEVIAMDDADVERSASEHKILLYQDKTHIPAVVSEILNNWDNKSQEKFFNAILTVEYKSRVIAYYKEFKKQIEERKMDINVVMTFSFGDDSENEAVDPKIIDEMFEDYYDITGIKFVSGDKVHGEDNYFIDLVDRTTRGGSARNPKNIDLVIVAKQLLTGYDSKYLNTLYVDRNLELQDLIQAYSRTNRLYGPEKQFGSVVNFKFPAITEEQVNRALKLYGSGGTSSRVIVEKYEEVVRHFYISTEVMMGLLPNPKEWISIKDTDKEKQFIEAFLDSRSNLNVVTQYYKYEWDDESFGLSEHKWLLYIGAYKNIVATTDVEEEEEILNPLIGGTKLSGHQTVDASHILELIGEGRRDDHGVSYVDEETLRLIYEEIQNMSDMGEANKAAQYKDFVDTQLTKGKVPSNVSFDDAFEEWREGLLNHYLEEYSLNWGIDYDTLKKSYNHFNIMEPETIPYLNDITESTDFASALVKKGTGILSHNIALTKDIKRWMLEKKKQL